MSDRAPGDIARALEALVDTLLPGDARFPSASSVGLHGVVAERLRALNGATTLDGLLDALESGGTRFAALDADGRIDAVKTLETAHPAHFEALRMIAYLAYYESPAVIRAVRALGRPYNDAPQPDGYRMEPFDGSAHLPRTAHGHYVKTGDVKPVVRDELPEAPLAPETVRADVGVRTGRGPLSRGTRTDAGR